MNQQHLNNYFSTHWRGHLNTYLYSGTALSKKIKPTEWVLDVGCGINSFKGSIKNLVAIDPAFAHADHQCTIEEFQTEQRFDVAFCLGSINFGTEETVLKQIQCVVNLLNPAARIYWRCNPGRQDHGNKECEEIDFFPWTAELLHQYALDFGFVLADCKTDLNNRIYAEWARSNT